MEHNANICCAEVFYLWFKFFVVGPVYTWPTKLYFYQTLLSPISVRELWKMHHGIPTWFSLWLRNRKRTIKTALLLLTLKTEKNDLITTYAKRWPTTAPYLILTCDRRCAPMSFIYFLNFWVINLDRGKVPRLLVKLKVFSWSLFVFWLLIRPALEPNNHTSLNRIPSRWILATQITQLGISGSDLYRKCFATRTRAGYAKSRISYYNNC